MEPGNKQQQLQQQQQQQQQQTNKKLYHVWKVLLTSCHISSEAFVT